MITGQIYINEDIMKQIRVYPSEFEITVCADGQIVHQIEDLSIGRGGHLAPMFAHGGY